MNGSQALPCVLLNHLCHCPPEESDTQNGSTTAKNTKQNKKVKVSAASFTLPSRHDLLYHPTRNKY